VNIKPSCSSSASCRLVQSTQHWQLCDSSTIKTLKKAWSIAETPYPKKSVSPPSILSQEEVARLIDAALTPYHRTLLMTLYATGVRRAELTHLKVSESIANAWSFTSRAARDASDRDVMLSPKLLEALREYWRGLRHKPSVWLFPGNRWHTGDTTDHHQGGLGRLQESRPASGPPERRAPNTLRHYLDFQTMSSRGPCDPIKQAFFVKFSRHTLPLPLVKRGKVGQRNLQKMLVYGIAGPLLDIVWKSR